MEPPYTHADQIARAVGRQPGLLVVDRLDELSATAALDAGRAGTLVLSQVDTFLHGADVAQSLLDMGVEPDQLAGLGWVLTVQRLPSLCTHCREPFQPDAARLERLRRLYPALDEWPVFVRAQGCTHCRGTGRSGEVTVFDIYPAAPDQAADGLPMEDYVLDLAAQGYLDLDDVLRLKTDLLRRVYDLVTSSQSDLVDSNAILQRKLLELETANRVLEDRTRALISLQEIGTALITSTNLEDLATQVCRRANDLCGADRAIFYLLGEADEAEVLAVSGWPLALRHRRVTLDPAERSALPSGPAPYNAWPPGIPPRDPDVEGARLRAGLHVPFLAQQRQVGFMVIHSTRRSRFSPAEVSLLQTFATQAALAIQRAALFEDLRGKIAALEAAQAGLAQKERIERELELARQVQQSMLPRTFPPVPGYAFAARNVSARQVGGDFYDVFPLGPDRFGLVIADVSGKGMPAALFMALTRSLLLAEARRDPSPAAVLASVNDLLLDLGEPNMFVTVFYGVVEAATRRLTFARAGHDRPMLLRGETVMTLDARGMALGLFESSQIALAEAAIDLLPGDRLVLYTDGMTDIQAPGGALYDLARFTALLQEHASQTPDALSDAVFAALAAYQAEADQFDDMTMLVTAVAEA